MAHTPRRGKALTRWSLAAAFSRVVIGSFRGGRELREAHDAALEFETVTDGMLVQGVDVIRWNTDGQIVELKVMLRPVKAINLIHERMGTMLKSLRDKG